MSKVIRDRTAKEWEKDEVRQIGNVNEEFTSREQSQIMGKGVWSKVMEERKLNEELI